MGAHLKAETPAPWSEALNANVCAVRLRALQLCWSVRNSRSTRSDSSHRLHHHFFTFSPHSIPVSSSSSPSSSLSLFALLISLLLTFRCCHANFPGDSVVMETGQQGRSADVWCCSGVCTNQSPVFGLVLLRRPCFFFALLFLQICPPSTIHTAAMWLPTNTFYKI